MTQLEIPGAPKPYHIAYKITEVDVNDVVGEPRPDDEQAQPSLRQPRGARPRRLDTQFDNCNFVVPRRPTSIDGVAAINLPLEATPRIARRAAWLVTDSAYKEALIQLRAKLESAARRRRRATGDAPAWTTEKAVVSEEPVLVPALETLDELEARAKAVSAVFRDQAAHPRLARRGHQLPRAPLVPHHRGHERHRHAPRERRRDRRERPGRRRPAARAVLPALRPHREGPAERRGARGRGEEARRRRSPRSRRRRCSSATAARCCSRAKARSA